MRRLLASVLFVAMGCGGSEDSTATTADTSVDTAAADTATPVEDVATSDTSAPDAADGAVDPFGPYPTGPYGNKVGEVVANLAWEGYVDPLSDALANTKPYVTTSMDQLRRDAKKGYALVHVSEFY